MTEDKNRDLWEDEDSDDDRMMEKMVGLCKTFNLLVFGLVIVLVAAIAAFVLMNRGA